MRTDTAFYCLHQVLAAPREWAAIGQRGSSMDTRLRMHGGELYGAWRSQIGRPRDEVTLLTRWPLAAPPVIAHAEEVLRAALPPVRAINSLCMQPWLRPIDARAPSRQGNYAFRTFSLPERHRDEFLRLCAQAWPDFEAAYDSQVIGLWEITSDEPGRARALLLTRRPDLAMWERSKLPQGETETRVREQLSRRYDLCDDTEVYTTTLITATDQTDTARWT
jgi:hypothetical protein